MSYLRTLPTNRLLAIVAAAVCVVVAGTAIAVAASSGGPVPPRKPLASAVHAALAAPAPQGVSGRVDFVNHLVDGLDLRGANPVLTGASGRFWAASDGRLRVELQANGGSTDAQFVSDGKSWWAYDGSSNTVYRGTAPQGHADSNSSASQDKVPPVSEIQKHLNELMQHANVTAAQPTDVSGEPAYDVRVSPKKDGGLLGGAELAWDATHGVPLHAALYARGDSTPVLEATVTDVAFGPVDSSAFSIAPPQGAKMQTVGGGSESGAQSHEKGARHAAPVTGLAKVRAKLPFKLAAPAALAGRKRSDVTLIGAGRGAAVVYGNGLDAVAVIQNAPKSAAEGKRAESGPMSGAQLPTVTIGGSKAQELSTPLGTVIRFERGGVAYTVIGSVDRAAAEAAARGL